MRKLLCFILTLALALSCLALAEETPLTMNAPGETVRPGRAVMLSFTAPAQGDAALHVADAQGQTVSVVTQSFSAAAGYNALWWNGTYQGVPAPQGEYRLVLTLNGETATAPVTIGPNAPYLAGLDADNTLATPDAPVTVTCYASEAGEITVGLAQGENWAELTRIPVEEGWQTYVWQTELYTLLGLEDGGASLTFQLTDAGGDESTEEHLALTLSGFSAPQPLPTEEIAAGPDGQGDTALLVEEVTEEPASPAAEQQVFTPAYGSPYQTDTTLNYWTLPMDITNEAAVWEVLMQPVTVLDDGGKKDNQHKRQIVMRAEPSADSAGVGVVTNLTQSVHVLEKGDEWTLVECYSSSFYDSKVKRWNQLVQGYVPTKYLKQVTPDSSMGIVVDKLTQRLYIFKDGALYDTLLCSTGLSNAKQPYNETRSGEFLLQNPAVGGWQDGNMVCELGIRFNGGDLIHQVPALVSSSGNKDYSTLAKKLGTKASHGCIRVQRNKTPKGTNMKWIWDNRQDEIKIIIWEDWQGRQIPIPEGDTVLYYNPNGGSLYHTSSFCYSAPKVTFEPFTYGQLEEEPFSKLKRCGYCAPPLRVSEIEEINAVYAPGGDHDPILTEARRKQLESEGLAD